jgi:hypothetical protein
MKGYQVMSSLKGLHPNKRVSSILMDHFKFPAGPYLAIIMNFCRRLVPRIFYKLGSSEGFLDKMSKMTKTRPVDPIQDPRCLAALIQASCEFGYEVIYKLPRQCLNWSSNDGMNGNRRV